MLPSEVSFLIYPSQYIMFVSFLLAPFIYTANSPSISISVLVSLSSRYSIIYRTHIGPAHPFPPSIRFKSGSAVAMLTAQLL